MSCQFPWNHWKMVGVFTYFINKSSGLILTNLINDDQFRYISKVSQQIMHIISVYRLVQKSQQGYIVIVFIYISPPMEIFTPYVPRKWQRTVNPVSTLTGGTEVNDLDDDPDLMLKENEPEAWSVTVDKKVSIAGLSRNFGKMRCHPHRKVLYPRDLQNWGEMVSS